MELISIIISIIALIVTGIVLYLVFTKKSVPNTITVLSDKQVNVLGEGKKFTYTPMPKIQARSILDSGLALTKSDTILKEELLKDPKKIGYLQFKDNYDYICKLLNQKPTIPNPEKVPLVPRQFTIYEVFANIKPAEALQFYQISALKNDIENSINANDRAAIAGLFTIASMMLSPESITAIEKLVEATEPDPNYQANILGLSRAEELGLLPVSPVDVQRVLR